MDALQAQLALRVEAFRREPAFVDGDAAREYLEKYLAPIHEHGETRVYERAGQVEAVIAWRYDEDSWFGGPVHTLAIDHRVGADVEPWLEDQLAEILPTLFANLDVTVLAAYVPAYRALTALGLGIDSVQLLGDVAVASRRLRAGALPVGVRIEPMQPGDVDAVVALYDMTFRAEPEHCWFGAHPNFLSSQRERFQEALAESDHRELVLWTDQGVRGHASATVRPDNPLWGPSAGMSLCFAPELRGRGVLRPVYARLLESMRAAGAVSFKGGTSQPAVIKLGREMQRTLLSVNLRRGASFGESHFAPYLPPRCASEG